MLSSNPSVDERRRLIGAIKVTIPNADTDTMITVSCRSCGSDLEDPLDAVCMHCGMPVGGRRPPEQPQPVEVADDREVVAEPPYPSGEAEAARPEPPGPSLSNEAMWKLGLWGSLLVSIVAVGVIASTLLSAAFRSPEPAAAQSASLASPADEGSDEGPIAVKPTPNFDPPLTEPITVHHPTLNVLTREHLPSGVLTFRLDGNYCGRGEGTITASGVITNYSMARQRFDYTITVDLIRAWNRSVIGTLETTIEDLDPLESVEWSVEMVSSRVATIDCDITSVVAAPAG